jgi:type II secretory pathway pseudopilin PulG
MAEAAQKKTCVLAIVSLVLGCSFFVPFLGLFFSLAGIILGIIALVTISKDEATLKGKGLAIGGIVAGAVGILVSIAVLIAIALPSFSKGKKYAYEAAARSNMEAMSTAMKVYELDHGKYPASEHDLVDATPPYYSEAHNNKEISGYKYSLEFAANAYKIIATPASCGSTGTKVFVLEQDGGIQEEECK